MAILSYRLVPLLTLAACLGCSSKPSSEPIVIGHVAPLSGADKPLGEHARNGILLAVKEVNADEERITGRKVEVVHGDTRSDVDTVAATAVRLVTINKVSALIGGTTVPQSEALARAVQPYGIPLITLSGAPSLPHEESVFSVGMSPSYQGQILARFVAGELKAEQVVVLTDGRSGASAALAAAFVKEFPRSAKTRVEEWAFRTEAEFPDLAGRVHKDMPAAVLFAGAVRDGAKLREQFFKAGVQVPLVFGGEEGSLATLQEKDSTKQKTYLATAFAADGGTASSQAFVKKYREQFNEEPDVYAALAYDSARLLFEGLRQAKSTENVRLRKALGSLESFDSLTGPLMFKPEQRGRRPVYILGIENGKNQVAKRYESDK